jgi:hypothetical protein
MEFENERETLALTKQMLARDKNLHSPSMPARTVVLEWDVGPEAAINSISFRKHLP